MNESEVAELDKLHNSGLLPEIQFLLEPWITLDGRSYQDARALVTGQLVALLLRGPRKIIRNLINTDVSTVTN